MTRKSIISAAAFGIAVLTMTNVAQAFDFGNMMNPGRWFDNDDDRYYDGYYGGPYGRYGGYGPYGPYGYGGPYGPYGGYGWGGPYGGYGGQPSTIVVNPSATGSQQQAPRAPQ